MLSVFILGLEIHVDTSGSAKVACFGSLGASSSACLHAKLPNSLVHPIPLIISIPFLFALQ